MGGSNSKSSEYEAVLTSSFIQAFPEIPPAWVAACVHSHLEVKSEFDITAQNVKSFPHIYQKFKSSLLELSVLDENRPGTFTAKTISDEELVRAWRKHETNVIFDFVKNWNREFESGIVVKHVGSEDEKNKSKNSGSKHFQSGGSSSSSSLPSQHNNSTRQGAAAVNGRANRRTLPEIPQRGHRNQNPDVNTNSAFKEHPVFLINNPLFPLAATSTRVVPRGRSPDKSADKHKNLNTENKFGAAISTVDEFLDMKHSTSDSSSGVRNRRGAGANSTGSPVKKSQRKSVAGLPPQSPKKSNISRFSLNTSGTSVSLTNQFDVATARRIERHFDLLSTFLNDKNVTASGRSGAAGEEDFSSIIENSEGKNLNLEDGSVAIDLFPLWKARSIEILNKGPRSSSSNSISPGGLDLHTYSPDNFDGVPFSSPSPKRSNNFRSPKTTAVTSSPSTKASAALAQHEFNKANACRTTLQNYWWLVEGKTLFLEIRIYNKLKSMRESFRLDANSHLKYLDELFPLTPKFLLREVVEKSAHNFNVSANVLIGDRLVKKSSNTGYELVKNTREEVSGMKNAKKDDDENLGSSGSSNSKTSNSTKNHILNKFPTHNFATQLANLNIANVPARNISASRRFELAEKDLIVPQAGKRFAAAWCQQEFPNLYAKQVERILIENNYYLEDCIPLLGELDYNESLKKLNTNNGLLSNIFTGLAGFFGFGNSNKEASGNENSSRTSSKDKSNSEVESSKKTEAKKSKIDASSNELALAGIDFSQKRCRENPVLRMFRDNQVKKDGILCDKLTREEYEYECIVVEESANPSEYSQQRVKLYDPVRDFRKASVVSSDSKNSDSKKSSSFFGGKFSSSKNSKSPNKKNAGTPTDHDVSNENISSSSSRIVKKFTVKNYLTCELCFDEEIIAEDAVQCEENGHDTVFCYDCVKRFVDGLCSNDWGLNVLEKHAAAQKLCCINDDCASFISSDKYLKEFDYERLSQWWRRRSFRNMMKEKREEKNIVDFGLFLQNKKKAFLDKILEYPRAMNREANRRRMARRIAANGAMVNAGRINNAGNNAANAPAANNNIQNGLAANNQGIPVQPPPPPANGPPQNIPQNAAAAAGENTNPRNTPRDVTDEHHVGKHITFPTSLSAKNFFVYYCALLLPGLFYKFNKKKSVYFGRMFNIFRKIVATWFNCVLVVTEFAKYKAIGNVDEDDEHDNQIRNGVEITKPRTYHMLFVSLCRIVAGGIASCTKVENEEKDDKKQDSSSNSSRGSTERVENKQNFHESLASLDGSIDIYQSEVFQCPFCDAQAAPPPSAGSQLFESYWDFVIISISFSVIGYFFFWTPSKSILRFFLGDYIPLTFADLKLWFNHRAWYRFVSRLINHYCIKGLIVPSAANNWNVLGMLWTSVYNAAYTTAVLFYHFAVFNVRLTLCTISLSTPVHLARMFLYPVFEKVVSPRYKRKLLHSIKSLNFSVHVFKHTKCSQYKPNAPKAYCQNLRCTNPNCGVLFCGNCGSEAHYIDKPVLSMLPKAIKDRVFSNHSQPDCMADLKASKCDEESFVNFVAEAMSRRMVRSCANCGLQYVKSDACNKMTCPECRTAMCYVCKEVISGYDHFCQHFRPSGGFCDKCDRCDLYKCYDEAAIKRAGNDAAVAFRHRFPEKNLVKEFGKSSVTIQGMRFNL